MTQVCKDPNSPTALLIREKFPTPQAIVTASLSALKEIRLRNFPSDAQLIQLQQLAGESIGTKEVGRQRGLIFEQAQLIKELTLLQEHLPQLDAEIESIIEHSREGKILTSMGIGPISTATFIAAIGSIANFENPAALRSYFGWAPEFDQTGTSRNRAYLTPRGNRMLKQRMFLVVWQLIRHRGSEWSKLYDRLVPVKCIYDERTQRHVGRGKVMGRIAGQIIGMFTEVFPSAPHSTFDSACEEL